MPWPAEADTIHIILALRKEDRRLGIDADTAEGFRFPNHTSRLPQPRQLLLQLTPQRGERRIVGHQLEEPPALQMLAGRVEPAAAGLELGEPELDDGDVERVPY